MQLPSTGKRQHAEPAEPSMAPPVSPPPPPTTVKLEAEELYDDGHGSLSKRAKAAQPTPPPLQQQVDPVVTCFLAFHLVRLIGTELNSALGSPCLVAKRILMLVYA